MFATHTNESGILLTYDKGKLFFGGGGGGGIESLNRNIVKKKHMNNGHVMPR